MFHSREEFIKEIKWNGSDGRVDLITDDGGHFSGMERKDFFHPQDDWESLLVPGVALRTWNTLGSCVAGVEALIGGAWRSVWYVGNDFDTKEQSEASDKAYRDFIDREGKRIAGWIDEGKTLVEIDDLIDDDHTGFTYGASLALGIQQSKNKDFSSIIQRDHNAKYGVKDSEGVVNPALMTVGV